MMSRIANSFWSINEAQFDSCQSVWVFGKGPSLETYDRSKVGSTRICINESLLLVDHPTYFFAHDEKPIKNVANKFPKSCTAILEVDRANYAVNVGIPANQVVTYQKQELGDVENADYSKLLGQGRLIGKTGTVHSAIHFCKLLGARSVNMIGFDGTGDYASKLKLEMPIGGGQHGRIRNDSIKLLESLGFDFEFCDQKESRNHYRPKVDYQSLYDRLRKNGYHDTDDETSHIKQHLPWIVKNLDAKTVLDIGCSSGKSLDLFAEKGFEAAGVDVSQVAVETGLLLSRDVHGACATNLPFEDSSFDLVVSADVFEHLTENDGIKACDEACRVARKYVFLKIAEREDATQKWKDLAGHPLHLTTRPIQWWKRHLEKFGRVRRLESELICIEIN